MDLGKWLVDKREKNVKNIHSSFYFVSSRIMLGVRPNQFKFVSAHGIQNPWYYNEIFVYIGVRVKKESRKRNNEVIEMHRDFHFDNKNILKPFHVVFPQNEVFLKIS